MINSSTTSGNLQTPGMPQMVKNFHISNKNTALMVIVAILVIGAGVLTGGFLSGRLKAQSIGAPGVKSSVNEIGSKDEKSFKDTATGVMKTGGIKGEGMYHLERTGGASQNVYLTSTVIDLSAFVDKKVQVWGETVAGRHAGWLMDVGKVKIVD